MASRTGSKDIITLRGSAAIVSEFFGYAANSILYNRAVYPEESFVKVKKYGLPMLLTQDEGVKTFITNLTSQLSEWLESGKLQRVVLVIMSKATQEVLERWNFRIETDAQVVEKGVSREKSDKEIMREIQAIMRQIASSITYLPCLEEPCVFATPSRFLKKPFPPPSPAKHIKSFLARRHGKKVDAATIPEGDEGEAAECVVGVAGLDRNFGFSKQFTSKYELGEEVGRGHFGYTCSAKFKKGDLKGQQVAVKVIPKAKMTTAIAIEDVRREVRILRALTGHNNLVQFYDAFEDRDNVYIVMELCEGGELLDRILSRGGKYSEDDAKAIMVQILNVVAYCHLQGVVHRDLKPELSFGSLDVVLNS